MGDLLELVVPATDRFELFSIEPEFIQAFEEGGKKKFRGIASSTTRDLHGDVITLEALQDMEMQAVGLTMFLNHSYDVPDDVGGTITKAIVRQKGVDQDGEPNYQLEIEGEVEEENPAALKTWSFVKKGRKLGLSIGAMIPTGGATRNKDGSLTIVRLTLLEVSFVGIPANPKSWIEYAASAIRQTIAKAESHTLGNPVLTLADGRYKIEGSLEGLDINLGADVEVIAEVDVPEEVPAVTYSYVQDSLDTSKTMVLRSNWDENLNAQVVVLGSWDLTDEADRLLAIATAGEEVIEKANVYVETRDGDKITIGEPEATEDIEPDVALAAACPTCGKGHDATGCDDAYHKDVDPDVTDAKIRIIEVDTDDAESSDGGSQGASASEPDEAEYAAPEADVTAEGEPMILDGATEDELLKLSFNQLRMVALRATTEMVEAKRALVEEQKARIAAEEQRDAVIEAAGELMARTSAVIEKVANSPLSRKAVIRDIEKTYSTSVEAYYGTEFARALAGTKK